MEIIKIGKKATIVWDAEQNNLFCMYLNKVYSMENWTTVDKPVRSLPYDVREECISIAKEMKDTIDELKKSKKKTTTKKSQPKADPITDTIHKLVAEVIAKESVDEVMKIATPLINQYIFDNFGMIPQLHKVELPDGSEHKFSGVTHEAFDKVLQLVTMDIPVFLTGEAGTGKNVICKQVAEALGLEFYFTNAVTQEYQIKGFIDANGKYHETQFYKAFKNGGLFFLDEMDASIPETLIILNSAIANRYFDFPTGKVEAHPDFRIVSAGNTIGMGSDIEYTGRFQLDASSLDRFALIKIDYSKKIENAISGGNEELCFFAREFRNACKKVGIRCFFTYRSVERISKLEKVLDMPDVLKISLLKGLGNDDIHMICEELSKFTNKYVTALRSLVA